MANLATSRLLPIEQKRSKAAIDAMFKHGADRVRSVLLTHAPDGGAIPRKDETAVVRAAGAVVQSLFVGPDGRSPFADDGVTPLAPYPALLNAALVRVQVGAVRAHRLWLEKYVAADVLAWLRGAGAPVATEMRVDDVLSASYRGRILPAYERAHTWVDPNGYVLSDRIWRTGVATRARLDALLAEGIRQGTGALDLSRLAEQFLRPSRAALRTRKPYGVDASFDAMRLTRTEIAAAFGRTTVLAAQLNPYVVEVDWKLSPSHPRRDICDQLAAKGPYPPDRVPSYPPHPQCLCVLVPRVADIRDVTAALREAMNAGADAPFTPVAGSNGDGFLLWLLGAGLFRLFQQQESATA